MKHKMQGNGFTFSSRLSAPSNLVRKMAIIIDAHGGDNAPLAVINGGAEAHKKYGVDIIFSGNERTIERCAKKNNITLIGCKILHSQADNSIAAGLKALEKGEGSAFVSAGSTGNLVMESKRILGCKDGVRRAAIAAVMPSAKNPFVLIDSGANLNCTPEILLQFAKMGVDYAKRVLKVNEPRVALLNIGTEEDKGSELHRASYELLKKLLNHNFIGNAEAREVPFGCCDVLVADGFSGNIFLKAYEGSALAILNELKAIYRKNPLTRLSALLVRNGINAFKNKIDYSQYGGAPILGFRGTVIKAHGSSDAKAICSAIAQAKLSFSTIDNASDF